MRNRAFRIGLPLLTLGFCVGLFAFSAENAPLREQDIVHWVTEGISTDTIVERLASVETVAFQLDSEMVEELRRAGINESILAAMRSAEQRLNSTARTEGVEPDIEVETVPTQLKLLSREEAEPSAVIYHASVLTQEELARAVDPAATRFPAIEDLVFFVGCLRDTHVPDHWRDLTILKRDFFRAPRHRLLWSRSAAELLPARSLPVKKKMLAALMGNEPEQIPEALQTRLTQADIHGRWFFKLVLPEQISLATVPSDSGHDLFAGIAVRYQARVLALHLRAPSDTENAEASDSLQVLRVGGWADHERTDALLQWQEVERQPSGN